MKRRVGYDNILGRMSGKLDLEWNDDDVVPATVNPDLEFLFHQMVRLTLQVVGAREGECILDVGCGRATDAAKLSRRGATVTGLEPSKVMLGRAKGEDSNVTLVQGIGESLPFRSCLFDKVMCKGALDHFFSPSKTMEEISRVLKPGGEVIIAIANFESLGFRIGKKTDRIRAIFSGVDEQRKPWELPSDHTYKFDCPSLSNLAKGYFQIKEVKGMSLLFGMPWWGRVLSALPRPISYGILNALDKLARPFPSLADVIVMKCGSSSQYR